MTPMDESSRDIVSMALAEDLGERGDITSQWTVPPGSRGRAVITANEHLVVAGLPLAKEVMRQVDPAAIFSSLVEDGAEAGPGEKIAAVDGAAEGILTAERTMLNFLMHLCGVATQSRRFAEAVQGTGAQVVDTRKTLPGMRAWEKRAVVLGGCGNHRLGLFDMVLIKDNHIEAAGGVAAALQSAKAKRPPHIKIEVEVETELQLRDAIAGEADLIMLDNQDLDSLKRMVALARRLAPGVVLEASGGVTLERVRAIAETGVDLISTSALTMGAPPADLALSLKIGA